MKIIMDRFSLTVFFTVFLLLATLETQAAAFVPYQVIDSSFVRVTTPQNLVIRTKAEWQAFYKAATSSFFPQPAVPAINFTNVDVIVVASGERATGGYKTLISNVSYIPATTSESSIISVQAVLVNPDVGCMVSQSFTYPVAIIKIPKTASPFQFAVSNVYSKCQ